MDLNAKSDFERFIFGSLQEGYPSDCLVEGIEQVPFLDKTTIADIPLELAAFDDRNRISVQPREVGIHFYKEDYKFASALLQPLKWVERFSAFKSIITPDLSIGDQMPRWIKVRNTVWSRAAGAIWNEQGFPVFPNLRWRSPDDYDFVAAGIHRGSVVATSNYGNRQLASDRAIFQHGISAMVERIAPEAVIIYGSLDARLMNYLESKTQVFIFKPNRAITANLKSVSNVPHLFDLEG